MRWLHSALSADHVTEMAMRAGAPDFTLHDLRSCVPALRHDRASQTRSCTAFSDMRRNVAMCCTDIT
ncbi:hypothetical protein WG70_25175 [Burkholderia oklahomensis EO147]|nr:hypothetical protein WG70_25175 [Burkholderia oklahomensis EO147]KUY58620.1 hypothetical protein WG70_07915 [Burkholderia oklahomensis EO147]